MMSNQLLLSGVVITKNEEQNIDKCLRSLAFCDEIILVDDNSIDQTVRRAKKYSPRIFKHSLRKNFSQQRNFALQKAKGKWVLFVDADEIVSKELADEILVKVTSTSPYTGYFLRRVDVLWNKPMFFGELAPFGAFGKGYLLRLAQRNAGTWVRDIHEMWNIPGETASLSGKLLHYPHQTYFEFLSDVGDRAQVHADALYKEHKQASLAKAVVWPVGKFLYNYVFRLGFLDGQRGFILAVTMSFHSFLSWGYLCLKQKS